MQGSPRSDVARLFPLPAGGLWKLPSEWVLVRRLTALIEPHYYLGEFRMGVRESESRLANVSLLAGLSKKELRSVRMLMTELRFSDGDTLIEQDTVGAEFMIMVEGSAVVRRNGRKIATLGAGDIMGELSVLSGEPRTATVVATSDIIVESLNRREFISLLDQSPTVAKKVLMRAVKSLHQMVNNHVA